MQPDRSRRSRADGIHSQGTRNTDGTARRDDRRLDCRAHDRVRKFIAASRLVHWCTPARIGQLVPSTAAAASYGLIALLVAMFPANVHAAREGLVIAGRRASPLVWRLPLQLFWILALWRVAQVSAGV